ncbi:MMPL family transporter [Phytohabitans suffuscus]|uniref:MMPL family transporter n=1 Tax=Phytohabitans suffuscus TaxID=624315 RepID=UPI0018D837F3
MLVWLVILAGAGAAGLSAPSAPEGERVTSPPYRSAIESAVRQLGEGGQVAMVADPFEGGAVSGDGSLAYASVMYAVKASGVTDGTRGEIEAAAGVARQVGLTVEAGGSAMEAGGMEAGGGVAEIIAIGLAALILLATFGSLVAAGLPLLTALLGVAVSMMSILAFGEALGLSATSGTMALMLGLAVGIDYALFVVSRYREEHSAACPRPTRSGWRRAPPAPPWPSRACSRYAPTCSGP